LHDAIAGDRIGIPSVGIMTSKFVSAAETMSRVLGAEGYEFVVIEHPISSASREALAEQARQAARASETLLVSG
jgi:hypothetical protein